MKKLLKYSLLFTSLFLVACGGGDGTSTPTTSNDVVSEVESEEVINSFHDDSPLQDREFRVRVLKDDNTPYYNEGLRAQWCSETGNCYPLVNVDTNGYARIKIPQDNSASYSVHLMGLDDAYAYNSNAYTTTPANNDIEIVLSEVKDSTSTKTLYGEKEVDVYRVDEGVYNATINEQGEYHIFEFTPSKPGKYKIESWAYDIMGVQTKIHYLGGSVHYLQNPPIETIEEGGLNGNAAYTLNHTSIYDSATYVYGFEAVGEYLLYPFSFNFEIAYVGEAEEEIIENEPVEVVDVHASEALSTYADQPATKILVSVPLDGSVTYVYNEDDRFYHLNSTDGPVIVMGINTEGAYVPGRLASIHTQTYGDPEYFILDNGTKNYAPMIEEYTAVCNKKGVYPATQELRECIELIIAKNNYFEEHETHGGFIYTQLGYVPAVENQWLYTCYYYKSLV